jgi:hypothetical protein
MLLMAVIVIIIVGMVTPKILSSQSVRYRL